MHDLAAGDLTRWHWLCEAHRWHWLCEIGLLTPALSEVPEPEALEGAEEDEDIWMDSPPADQQQKFTNSPPEEEAILQRNGAVKSMCHFRQTL